MWNAFLCVYSRSSLLGTSNGLNDQAGEGYDHITLAKEMDVMDLPMLQFINNQIVPGRGEML